MKTMKRERIALGALVAMAAALVMFSGVAEADVVVNGVTLTNGNYTTSAVYIMNNSGVNTIDGGSHWTHNETTPPTSNDGIFIIGHSMLSTLTVSGGGWLEATDANPSDAYAITLGNQTGGAGDVTVTGTGSKITAPTSMRVGRRSATVASNTIATTLTIEDGGLVMLAAAPVYGTDNQTGDAEKGKGLGYVRMGYGGILAVSNSHTLTEMAVVGNGSGAFQYWDGSDWDDITNATEGASDDYTLTYYSSNTSISGMNVNGYTVLEMIVPPPAGTVLIIR